MFRILILQMLDPLSDDATAFQIRDRLSFMCFLGLGLEDPVPDARTIWLFREQLTRAGAITTLFADIDAWLKRSAIWQCPARSSTPRSSPRPGKATPMTKGGAAGRPGPAGLGREAGEARPEGPRCPLDVEAGEGPQGR